MVKRAGDAGFYLACKMHGLKIWLKCNPDLVFQTRGIIQRVSTFSQPSKMSDLKMQNQRETVGKSFSSLIKVQGGKIMACVLLLTCVAGRVLKVCGEMTFRDKP